MIEVNYEFSLRKAKFDSETIAILHGDIIRPAQFYFKEDPDVIYQTKLHYGSDERHPCDLCDLVGPKCHAAPRCGGVVIVYSHEWNTPSSCATGAGFKVTGFHGHTNEDRIYFKKIVPVDCVTKIQTVPVEI